jgi:hypothetical protein
MAAHVVGGLAQKELDFSNGAIGSHFDDDKAGSITN